MCTLCVLKLLHFALFCCCLATTHAPNQEINISNTSALVEHWCHQLTSEATIKSVQATILHALITLPSNKNVLKLRFSRSWTLLVSYSNNHIIESSAKFHVIIGNICVHIWRKNNSGSIKEMNSLSLILE